MSGKRDERMPELTFWFEFASLYSYLSAMRIEELAKPAGVRIVWKPFLLGPIFKAQGWETSPFNLYPAKGRHMIRDLERIAGDRGLVFRAPEPFPQNGLQAARLAIAGLDAGWTPAFVKAVYTLEFAQGRNIADRAPLADALDAAGAPVEEAFACADSPHLKQALRTNTEDAQAKGLFGAPSFTTASGELFWGDDRLEQALSWSGR
jgi:2-hydroxychromene-2-carboxylate isomerase